ncbi:Transcription initiation factor IIA small chain (TFIIA 13.5 kDa subunit) [Nowakowskiella sp. JEL0407]|nr:Transcription initiation factor IIA small chain (TFIIA 13.5 kDa subunit) [Nowakowskiella sp. JEL0407]
MAQASPYELYRRSTIGTALIEALDELHGNELIDPQMAMKILSQFDLTVSEALQTHVKNRAIIKSSRLTTYRFCDDVWSFIARDPMIKIDNESITADKIKIVACNASQKAS